MDFLKYLINFFEKAGFEKASLFISALTVIATGALGLVGIVELFEWDTYRWWVIGLGMGGITLLLGISIILIHKQERQLKAIEAQIRKKQIEDLHPHFSEADVDHAQKYYIKTKGQNVPPSRDQEPGLRSAFTTKEPLIPLFLDQALKNIGEDDRFYLVLADSGMGKTTFMLNLYLTYVRNRAPHDYEMKLFAFRYPSAYEDVKRLVESGEDKKTILLLDAFDEDGEASKNYKERLDQWMDLVKNFREVIITSRTQFFPSEDSTKGLLQVPKNNPLNPGFHQFKFMYISPFSDEDIQDYVHMRFSGETPEDEENKVLAFRIVQKSPRLMVRPMLLANIDAFLNDPDRAYDTTYEIYDVLIERWLWREAGRKHGQEQRFYDELRNFSEALAIKIFDKWEKDEQLHITKDELSLFAEKHQFDLNILSELEMQSKSLLNRDAPGNLKFSHKSILEFFFASLAENDPDFLTKLKLREFDMTKTFILDRAKLILMTKVEGGEFLMDENYKVKLSPYEISTYPVTQSLWKEIMGDNPSSFKGDLIRPVENVSWEDCQVFIQKLNQKTGSNYRLPTEAEWEFAARGGNLSKGFEYAGSNTLDEVGWYDGNSGSKTHPVGQKEPNELGLYDMSGNVWEWCQDWYEESRSGTYTNPKGAESGESRVIRGGCWVNVPQGCRVADRASDIPSDRDDLIGFRLSRHL
ncbi:MAG: SUMF1/EgtB/PvdO family nonheme iron enzyme [Bacteroidota bacterium]